PAIAPRYAPANDCNTGSGQSQTRKGTHTRSAAPRPTTARDLSQSFHDVEVLKVPLIAVRVGLRVRSHLEIRHDIDARRVFRLQRLPGNPLAREEIQTVDPAGHALFAHEQEAPIRARLYRAGAPRHASGDRLGFSTGERVPGDGTIAPIG